MKVLYITAEYPHLSESYIFTEIEWMLGRGVVIEVWSKHRSPSEFPEQVKVHRGELVDAVHEFQPDILHMHWLESFPRLMGQVYNLHLPMTIRGHRSEGAHV